MANVFIEPKPKGRAEGDAITHYEIEEAGGKSLDGKRYPTQDAAITAAKSAGHHPVVARVRVTDKGKPDQWRTAS